MQKVKIMTQFVKQKYQKIAVILRTEMRNEISGN